MGSPPKYSPDRSLLLAIGVLTGALLICVGGAYVVSSLSGGVGGGGGSIAGAGGSVPAPSGYAAEGARSRGGSAPIAGGGVPAWAGSGGSSAPSGPFAPAPQGSYKIAPDFGAADLGAPPVPSSGVQGSGAAIADAGGPTGGAPQAGSAPLTPDLGGGSSGTAASGGGSQAWRSEARALASRTRALSRELGRLNENRGDAHSASSSASSRAPGKAETSSGGPGPSAASGPGTPSDPSQVPLGGAEWLAAAGAAYALNRLRKGTETDDADEKG